MFLILSWVVEVTRLEIFYGGSSPQRDSSDDPTVDCEDFHCDRLTKQLLFYLLKVTAQSSHSERGHRVF